MWGTEREAEISCDSSTWLLWLYECKRKGQFFVSMCIVLSLFESFRCLVEIQMNRCTSKMYMFVDWILHIYYLFSSCDMPFFVFFRFLLDVLPNSYFFSRFFDFFYFCFCFMCCRIEILAWSLKILIIHRNMNTYK